MHTCIPVGQYENIKLLNSLDQLLLGDIKLFIDSLDLLLVEADLFVLVLHLLLHPLV